LGKQVCSNLKSGTSVKRLASILSGSEKAVLVEAATYLCLKYKVKVVNYYATTTTTAPRAPIVLWQQSGSGAASGPQFHCPQHRQGME
jgi:hypothetical protein